MKRVESLIWVKTEDSVYRQIWLSLRDHVEVHGGWVRDEIRSQTFQILGDVANQIHPIRSSIFLGGA